MLLYDVFFVWQVLNHMGLQELKTEVDQSLEPGRDLRANEKNLFQATGNMWEDFINHCAFIVWCSLFTRDNLKLSSWRVILVKLTEKTYYLPKIIWVLFLSYFTVFFQH